LALLHDINVRRPCHIVTIEDPIEFVHPPQLAVVRQRELGTHTRSFANALRAALRQDPDVILVGEMRDAETMALAITAAETGHLVLSTVHTQDASQAIDRIVDAFGPDQQPQIRGQLAQSIAGVVAQKLLPRARGDGRVAAIEVLVGTTGVRNQIRDAHTHQLYGQLETGSQHGMQTLEQHLAQLVREGRVDERAARRAATRPESFDKALRGPLPIALSRRGPS
jgi:twitching motility protein PilT